jgi:hypothetical protein
MGSYVFRKSTKGFYGWYTPTWAGAIGAVGVLIAMVCAWGMYETRLTSLGAIGGFVVAVIVLISVTLLARRRIEVDDDGIRIAGRRGTWTEIRWAEDHEYRTTATALMRNGQLVRTVAWGRVSTPDGRWVELDDTFAPRETDTVSVRVEARSVAHSLPRLQQAFAAGQELVFGPVRVSRARVTVGTHSVEGANAVSSLRVRNGQLFFERDGAMTPTLVQVREGPHLRCLLALGSG